MSREAEKTQSSIEKLAAEYKDAFLHNDRFLEGFGKFTALDAINSVKAEEREECENAFERKKYKSGPTVNTETGVKYFGHLAKIENNFSGLGDEFSITYSRLEEYVQTFVSEQLDDLLISSDSYLNSHSRFTHAWFNDMLRAAIRGLRKTNCELLDFPSMYLDEQKEVRIPINEPKPSKEYKLPGFIRRNMIPIGFATILLALGVNKAIDFYVLNRTKEEIRKEANILKQEAKKALELKEKEWEMKINAVPYQAIKALEEIADKCMLEYLPDLDISLPFEKKYQIVCNNLTEDGKNEFKQEFNEKSRDLIEKLKKYLANISDDEIREQFQRIIDIVVHDSNK